MNDDFGGVTKAISHVGCVTLAPEVNLDDALVAMDGRLLACYSCSLSGWEADAAADLLRALKLVAVRSSLSPTKSRGCCGRVLVSSCRGISGRRTQMDSLVAISTENAAS